MELSPSFPKSLLQPLPEALERISGAWKSMQDEKAAASSGDEENAPMAAQPSTPHAALDAAIDRQTAALQTEMRAHGEKNVELHRQTQSAVQENTQRQQQADERAGERYLNEQRQNLAAAVEAER